MFPSLQGPILYLDMLKPLQGEPSRSSVLFPALAGDQGNFYHFVLPMIGGESLVEHLAVPHPEGIAWQEMLGEIYGEEVYRAAEERRPGTFEDPRGPSFYLHPRNGLKGDSTLRLDEDEYKEDPISSPHQHREQINDEDLVQMLASYKESSEFERLCRGLPNLILFLGRTRTGKSTTVNYLKGDRMVAQRGSASGSEFEVEQDDDDGLHTIVEEGGEATAALAVEVAEENQERGEESALFTSHFARIDVHPKQRRASVAKIGHGKISETLYPTIRFDTERDLTFCDCPGFSDSRGPAKEMVAAILTRMAIQSSPNGLKAICIVMSMDDLGSTGENLIWTLEILKNMLDNPMEHARSIFFLFTKPHNAPVTDFMGSIREARDAQQAIMMDTSRDAVLRQSAQDMAGFLTYLINSYQQSYGRLTTLTSSSYRMQSVVDRFYPTTCRFFSVNPLDDGTSREAILTALQNAEGIPIASCKFMGGSNLQHRCVKAFLVPKCKAVVELYKRAETLEDSIKKLQISITREELSMQRITSAMQTASGGEEVGNKSRILAGYQGNQYDVKKTLDKLKNIGEEQRTKEEERERLKTQQRRERQAYRKLEQSEDLICLTKQPLVHDEYLDRWGILYKHDNNHISPPYIFTYNSGHRVTKATLCKYYVPIGDHTKVRKEESVKGGVGGGVLGGVIGGGIGAGVALFFGAAMGPVALPVGAIVGIIGLVGGAKRGDQEGFMGVAGDSKRRSYKQNFTLDNEDLYTSSKGGHFANEQLHQEGKGYSISYYPPLGKFLGRAEVTLYTSPQIFHAKTMAMHRATCQELATQINSINIEIATLEQRKSMDITTFLETCKASLAQKNRTICNRQRELARVQRNISTQRPLYNTIHEMIVPNLNVELPKVVDTFVQAHNRA